MGYYTYYSMRAKHIKSKEEYEAIVQALVEEQLYETDNNYDGIFNESTYIETTHEATFDAYDECKWYDHTDDMIKFSKKFPDVIFRLAGDGEERNDMWHEYFHNGEVEECPAEIIFPKPVDIPWDE